MKAEIQDRWVEALRSGEYIQGQGTLARTEAGKTSHCCLGVLCDLADRDGVVNYRDSIPGGQVSFDHEVSNLPLSVQIWAGITSDNPHVEYEEIDVDGEDLETSLAELNDDHHLDFYAIADIIEQQGATL